MIPHILTILSAALFTMGLTKWYIHIAESGQIYDVPNERSSHKAPTPVGAGLPLLFVVGLMWPLLTWPLSSINMLVLAGMVFLAVISWLDDRNRLSSWSRLLTHALAVLPLLVVLPVEAKILPFGLHLLLDRAITAFAWLWFINLFNFMDGIDGLAGTETLTVSFGVAAVGSHVILGSGSQLLAVILGGAAMGFLWWNWHPAKVFMGDVGSIPLGFALGWLLIDLAIKGQFAAALILPLYYLVDATATLLSRLMRRERVWEAHKRHFYQRAVQAGYSHSEVVLRIAVVNVLLVGLALLSLRFPVASFGLAAIGVTGLMLVLRHMAAEQS